MTQDPWFGGGARRMLEAFLEVARTLGREPIAHYLSREHGVSLAARSFALRARRSRGSVAHASLLPELDAFNQLSGGLRIARELRHAPPPWVVAAAASHGLAAASSGRPYACWVATVLEDEWRSRAPGLPHSRRMALAANAPVLRRVERVVLRRAALVYTTSAASARAIAAVAGLPVERVCVLPIPVDANRFSPLPEDEWRSGLDAPVLAFVGRAFDPRKNLQLLLDALPLLRERVPGARLRLIGEPPLDPMRERLGPTIEVAGEVASVPDALRTAALFVLPSLQEGFGIVVAEALACGVPALVTPSGGPEELVRQSGGGSVLGSFAPAELAQVAASMLADRDRLSEMRRRGREYVVAQHSSERLRDGVRAALEELEARA